MEIIELICYIFKLQKKKYIYVLYITITIIGNNY